MSAGSREGGVRVPAGCRSASLDGVRGRAERASPTEATGYGALWRCCELEDCELPHLGG